MRNLIKVLSIIMLLVLTSCMRDADIASRNLSLAADQFEVFRRVVFYNGITNEYILVVEGYCSIKVDVLENQLELTVKVSEGQYLKHFLGLSDNVTYFAEQLQTSAVSSKQYRVIFKPSVIVPNIEVK